MISHSSSLTLNRNVAAKVDFKLCTMQLVDICKIMLIYCCIKILAFTMLKNSAEQHFQKKVHSFTKASISNIK